MSNATAKLPRLSDLQVTHIEFNLSTMPVPSSPASSSFLFSSRYAHNESITNLSETFKQRDYQS